VKEVYRVHTKQQRTTPIQNPKSVPDKKLKKIEPGIEKV
jgi:translation elongation factor EF-4